MIDYKNVSPGDILRVVGEGAPGWAKNGDLVRVISKSTNGVVVERKDGQQADFVFNCGASRLEATEWKNDFSTTLPKGNGCSACGGSGIMGRNPNAPFDSITRHDVPCPECSED